MRVLVVEDELKVADALREGLEGAGYEVLVERTGEGAFFRLTTEVFGVIVLDLTLPGRDGIQILSAVRARHITTPVLVLTARDTLEDRIRGLDGGADDYLVKPFAFAEVLARIRALLRRERSADARTLEIEDLAVDLATRQVSRGGRPIEVTAREFEVLAHLLRHKGQVVSRETLAREVWMESSRSSTLDNIMDVHMARLRKKIDLNAPARLIHTIRGVGFVIRQGEP